MRMKITSPWVKKAVKCIDSETLEIISNYYADSFTPDPMISFKFRFFRGFYFDANTQKYLWRSLHNLFNKRTFTQEKLKNLIPIGISKGFFPIRIFYSSTQWLNPREVGKEKDFSSFMINSGIAVLESDLNLEESIIHALQIDDVLEEKLRFVFTGNKSIHVWLTDFNAEKWLDKTYDILEFSIFELEARRNLFGYVKDATGIPLDSQTTIDIYRLIPIVGSLNAFTSSKVLELTRKDLEELSATEIREISKTNLFK